MTERKHRKNDLEQRAKEQAALNVIAKATSRSLDRDELLDIALQKVLEATGRELHRRIPSPERVATA